MSAVHHAFELATGPILTVVGAEPQATMVPGPAARAAFRPPEAARASLSARMVERALDLRGSPWVHMGRDAGLGLDHVGFVRDCLRHATGQEPADVLGYRAGWEDGLSMIAAGALILDWMWSQVLPQLQSIADKGGFGNAWRAMCRERTRSTAAEAAEAAEAAWAAARAAGADFWSAANPPALLARLVEV